MPDLSQRSDQKEILDREGIPYKDIYQNMVELNKVNSLLGGHAITIEGVKKVSGVNEPAKSNKTILDDTSAHTGIVSGKNAFVICEIGCGGGDNLAAIHKAFPGNRFSYIGIDIKKECIDTATKQYPNLPAQWIVSDYSQYEFKERPSVIFSSLFCHHFKDEEIISMLRWMDLNSSKGFFINDLHRNILAYYSIKWLTRIFSKSYLVKNDAPISVARGFRKKEWDRLLTAAGIHHSSIEWKWAFRYLVTVTHD